MKEKNDFDCQSYGEYEERYEAEEFKWITNFVVNNLIFLRSELGITNEECLAYACQVFWDTLDLFAMTDHSLSLDAALKARFDKLRSGMTALYNIKAMNKEQVAKALEYTRRTLFGHLQLYLVCLGDKQ